MTTFALKMLAVLFMLLDHIYMYFFSPARDVSLLLTCVGRLAYPLFMFSMVWGYHHTRNRKIYLLRLYLGSLFMTALSFALDTWLPTEGGFGNHNIFLSLFVVGFLISTIETMQKDRRKGGLMLGAVFAAQVLHFVLPGLIPPLRHLNGDLLTGIVPNIYLNEYGFSFIMLGVIMYFLKEKREVFSAAYIIFCIAQFSGEMLAGGGLPTQWLMIGALPLMLRYNGRKGPGMKYFFYIFYPAHTFLLFWLANFVL